MQALKAVTALMAVLIVAGTATLIFLIIHRLNPAPLPAAHLILHQPQGTRLVGLAATPTGLAVALTGGGPDRIVLLNPTTFAPAATITLAP
jgi:hypothetical protein